MKLVYASGLWLANLVTAWLAELAGHETIGLFGWSLGGATVYMLFEIVSNVSRPGLHRFYLVLIGLFLGMAFGPRIATRFGWDPVGITTAISLFGYVMLGPIKDLIIKYIAKKAETLTKSDAELPAP